MAPQLKRAIAFHSLILKFIVLICAITANIQTTDAWTGMCFGEDSSNIPGRPEVVARLKDLGITRVRLYHTNNETLRAFANSGLQITVGITNEDFPTALANLTFAREWVWDNIAPYEDSNIVAVTVGNEVLTTGGEAEKDMLLPAMQNLQEALLQIGHGRIKVTTPHSFEVLTNTFPPSSGQFADPIRMQPIVDWLSAQGSNFFCEIYPYFMYTAGGDITLPRALLENGSTEFTDDANNLTYSNLLEQKLDAVYAALEKVGYTNVSVTVGEIGWPSAGGGLDTSPENAQTHNQNVVRIARGATPLRPGSQMEVYMSSMFNENQKRPGIEQNFGLYDPSDFQSVYLVDFETIVAQANRITQGMILRSDSNQSVSSNNGLTTLVMQPDCNLVLFHKETPVWESRTNNTPVQCYLVMQDDGNLVIYGPTLAGSSPVARWATDTWGLNDGDHYMEVQDDGNAVMYAEKRQAIWATNTVDNSLLGR